ncbi:MAG: HAD hydrolase-like protein, partial [Candidatus Peribacteraceae bacterium]|nr:HAD hydrolase-like protein [Candidatus Peribacteraceae bacterium]
MMGNLKLIIFDVDGVICDSKSTHYEALNRALEEIHP